MSQGVGFTIRARSPYRSLAMGMGGSAGGRAHAVQPVGQGIRWQDSCILMHNRGQPKGTRLAYLITLDAVSKRLAVRHDDEHAWSSGLEVGHVVWCLLRANDGSHSSVANVLDYASPWSGSVDEMQSDRPANRIDGQPTEPQISLQLRVPTCVHNTNNSAFCPFGVFLAQFTSTPHASKH